MLVLPVPLAFTLYFRQTFFVIVTQEVGVLFFATLLSSLAKKQPNTALNESCIIIIKAKLLFQFCCPSLVTKVLDGRKMLTFFIISANLMIICSCFLSSKCIIADFPWLFLSLLICKEIMYDYPATSFGPNDLGA